MTFDPNSPDFDNNKREDDLNQIRENLNELRANEYNAAFPDNPTSGQFAVRSDIENGSIHQYINGGWTKLWSVDKGFNQDALNTAYDNTDSGLTSTDIKNAIDELDTDIDTRAIDGDNKQIKLKTDTDANIGTLTEGVPAWVTDRGQIKVGSSNGNITFSRQNFIHVKDYGAKGDGITDDTTAIKNALNDVKENGFLWFGYNKEYFITDKISHNKNINIIGNGSKIKTNFNGDGLVFTGELKDTISLSNDYNKADYRINLSDTTNLEDGDILNIVSTELFNTSRTYYYKGGNVLAKQIDTTNNACNIVPQLPFDLLTADVTIKIYKPITVNIFNLEIVNTETLPNGRYGINIKYGKNCKLNMINTDNFNHNLKFDRCINTRIENIETGRAYYDGSGESYGISLYSCTNFNAENIFTASGRHGFTVSGEEPSFTVKIKNSSILNERDKSNLHSLDSHGSCYNMKIENCNIFVAGVHGNIEFDNCTFYNNDINRNINLSVAEEKDYGNYYFNNCRFIGNAQIRIVGYSQETTTTRIHIGNIEFNNCTTDDSIIALDIDMEETYGSAINSNIKNIKINNTKLSLNNIDGVIDKLIYNNVNIYDNRNLITQETNDHNIGEILINNCDIPNRYQVLKLTNFNQLIIRDCNLVNVGSSEGSFLLSDSGAQVIIEYTDLSNFGRGLDITASELIQHYSPINYQSNNASTVKTTSYS